MDMDAHTNSDAFIEAVNAHNIDHIFFSPGGEFIGLQSVIAQARLAGKKAPQLVLCLDEAVTLAAAHGHYMVSGKPQVVLVHSELGTLQLGGNLQNIQWGRVPVVILAAYQADGLRTTWKGEPYDQGSAVRNNMKWDCCVTNAEDVGSVLTEAFRVACTEPTGPVYVTFPFDYFGQAVDRPEVAPAPPAIGAIAPLPPGAIAPLPPADPAALGRVADLLLQAKNPLLVTGIAGRHPENVEAMVRLAETLSAPVLTGQVWMNFPTDHPLCLGIEQIGGSLKPNPGIAEADVILAIDYDMPYVGGDGTPSREATIIHLDVDPLTNGRVLWERGADVFLKCDSREAIPELQRLLSERINPAKRQELQERYLRVSATNREARREWRALAESQAAQKPISPDWLCYCVNQVIDEDTIVVAHTITHCASVTEQIERTKPGTLFGCPAGAIGWAMGAPLGAKVAAPEKTVVSLLTDGGFIWGCPTSTLWTAVKYGAPFLAVVFNNQGYGILRGSLRHVLGTDSLPDPYIFEAGAEFMPDYAMIARACGAHGRTVDDPADVLPALKEALAAVRAGQAAVLDVRLGRN
jgi:acetolactate synthase-1/2/3 large subunit